MALRLQIVLGTSFPPLPVDRPVVDVPPAASWPFLYPLTIDWPAGASIACVPAIHEAFVNHQTSGTRLVTTQATYLFLAWSDIVGEGDTIMLATADRDALAEHAPEILARRGAFGETLIDAQALTGAGASGTSGAGSARSAPVAPNTPLAPAVSALAAAFRSRDARERLEFCVRALDEERTAATLVAAASACMEVNDLEAAARDLEEAIALASDWAAAHFEQGKLWLRRDDMQRASESFRAAATRLPRFGAAWSNLGATLGELDRTAEALAAFTQALACDADAVHTLNNMGVLQRELGQLADSAAAFRRVIALAPSLAFGYYNLGHTLFLEGRFQAALAAYVEGQKRDAEHNAVQATRLAMCRLATGDSGAAIVELQRAIAPLPAEYRQQLLADTQSIAWALLTHQPDLPGWQQVNDWLMRELARP